MKLEGHLQNDMKRFGKEFRHVHEWMDEHHGTPEFWSVCRHCFEAILTKFVEGDWHSGEFRAAIFHLLDDFGNDLPSLSEIEKGEHWLAKHCKEKGYKVGWYND